MKVDNNWVVLKYQDKSLSWEADFIEQHKCDSGQAVFDRLILLGALTLPSEKDLKTACRSLKDTVINGLDATEIREASQDSDGGFYRLKTNYQKNSREIFYYDPASALKICQTQKKE